MTLIFLRGSLTDDTYHYQVPGYGEIIWNVSEARRLLDAHPAACLAQLAIDPEQMRNIAQRCEWDAKRLDAVDPTIPGIAAPMVWEGTIIYVLIDGLHRNARALRDGLPFEARLLTEDASRRCLITAPRGLMPWEYVRQS